MSRVIDFLTSKREDMLLFAVSLVIAFALFVQLQVGLEPGKEREFEVLLSFTNLSDDITVLQAPRSVKVVASGSQQVLDALDTSKVRAVVDLSLARPGVRRYRIDVIGPLQVRFDAWPSAFERRLRARGQAKEEL